MTDFSSYHFLAEVPFKLIYQLQNLLPHDEY